MTVYIEQERFTDQDVRDSPSLYQTACNQAKDYRGDFDFMRRARRQMEMDNALTIGTARGVLNALLAQGWRPADLRNAEPESPPLALEPVLLPPYFPVKSFVHANWLTSTAIGTYCSHRIDKDRSYATYFREMHTICFTLFTRCGYRWQSHRFNNGWNTASRVLTKEPVHRECFRCEVLEANDD